MQEDFGILPPSDEGDTEGARRVFNEFLNLYQPVLVRVEQQLEQEISRLDPMFAEAYKPWKNALHDLLKGAHLLARRIPLPDIETFREALALFSFDGAIQFILDISVSCKLSIEREWIRRFREHIRLLLFSFGIINRQQQEVSVAR